jgi:magnesium transporter
MAPRAAALIALRMPSAERDGLYQALPAAHAGMLRTLTEYGDTCAGGRMDPRVPMVPETLPVSEVLDRLRLTPEGALNYLYAVDAERRLTGVVNLRELLSAPANASLAAIMQRDPDAIFADDPLEAIASHASWKRHHALPVVDREGRLLGALRYRAFRAIEAELGRRSQAAPDTQAASALAELCVLGITAVTRMVGVALATGPDQHAGDAR